MGVTTLPTFRGWTVDVRLQQFRKVEYGKPWQFVEFDSTRGRRLLRALYGEFSRQGERKR